MSQRALSNQFEGFSSPRPYFPQKGADKGPSMGSQGKLFRDPKPTAEHRYQKGYTPERMRDVRSMPITIHPGASDKPFGGPAGARQVHEVIARSTTPHDEIPGHGGELQIKTGTGNIRGSRRGQNIGAGAYINKVNAQGTLGAHGAIHLSGGEGRQEQSQTLVHELGHWKSNREWTEHSYVDSPWKRGREEAYADDNMMNRWRPDPRDVRRGTSAPPSPSYEYEGAHRGIGGKSSFKAYNQARTTPNVKEAGNRKRAAENTDASHQPQMLGDTGGGRRTPPTGHRVESWGQAEGTLHPMQFGKLGNQ